MPSADAPEVRVADRAALHAWLETHRDDRTGVWLVTGKGADRTVVYEEVVEELLCFGWIDAQARRADDGREPALWIAPRKPGSGWSRVNKDRVARLEAAGLLHAAGSAAIEAARASGTWTALDGVEAGVEPPDLTTALDGVPAARATWDAFPPSARKAILQWIASAKTPRTREVRIATTAAEAAEGRRANQWRPRADREP